MPTRRVLVTGGAGFIGSHVVAACMARGDDVIVFDDLSTGHRGNLPTGVDLCVGDVADARAVLAAAAGCEVVFHLAAHRSVARSVESPLETDRANVGGTLAVLEAARAVGARRVVSSSSSSVYGGAVLLPTPESAPLQPRSPYAVSKLAGEHYCRVFWELYGLETVALRYFNVYGPRQRPDSAYAAVVPLFIQALTTGSRPQVHGDGLQRRAFTYVSDTVEAILLAADAPSDACCGRAFNVAAATSSTVLDLLDTLSELLGVSVDAEHLAPRAGDVRDSSADLTAVTAAIGYRPHVALREGLARTLEWFGREA